MIHLHIALHYIYEVTYHSGKRYRYLSIKPINIDKKIDTRLFYNHGSLPIFLILGNFVMLIPKKSFKKIIKWQLP